MYRPDDVVCRRSMGRRLLERHRQRTRLCTFRIHCRRPERLPLHHTCWRLLFFFFPIKHKNRRINRLTDLLTTKVPQPLLLFNGLNLGAAWKATGQEGPPHRRHRRLPRRSACLALDSLERGCRVHISPGKGLRWTSVKLQA